MMEAVPIGRQCRKRLQQNHGCSDGDQRSSPGPSGPHFAGPFIDCFRQWRGTLEWLRSEDHVRFRFDDRG